MRDSKSVGTSPEHPFLARPHATLVRLSFPVLLSLIAEPLTGLVDTAFIKQLGAESLAALGVGAVALSSLFWVFNFLGISTQTEVAQAEGDNDRPRSVALSSLGIIMSMAFGLVIIVVGLPLTSYLATLLGAAGAIHAGAVDYIFWRWLGAPAILITLTACGALRGLQDMRSPLWIALGINSINIVLDPILIFGAGPVPALGIAGAAVASVVAYWIGAAWAIWIVRRKLGWSFKVEFSAVGRLMRAGTDLFIRTGVLNLFLLLTTREATHGGADIGAAHQAIRQVWMFGTFVLDALAVTGQSLVAYFLGGDRIGSARKVARIVCLWSVWSGCVLGLILWLGSGVVIDLLVPATAVAYFHSAWIIAVVVQPLNALAFATDGLHWGSGDYRYLRNAVVLATGVGAAGLLAGPHALDWIWLMTGAWIGVRATLGVIRIWPGVGSSPFRVEG